jgi:hypothetical protein
MCGRMLSTTRLIVVAALDKCYNTFYARNLQASIIPFTVVFYNVSNKLDFDRGPGVMTTFAVVIYNVFNKLDFDHWPNVIMPFTAVIYNLSNKLV